MKHPETDEDFRAQVCDWFRANGVDPNRLPMDPRASIADGQLTFRQTVPGPDGTGDRIDPADRNSLLYEVVTVPIAIEPPFDVAEWLRPKCPTCGRRSSSSSRTCGRTRSPDRPGQSRSRGSEGSGAGKPALTFCPGMTRFNSGLDPHA